MMLDIWTFLWLLVCFTILISILVRQFFCEKICFCIFVEIFFNLFEIIQNNVYFLNIYIFSLGIHLSSAKRAPIKRTRTWNTTTKSYVYYVCLYNWIFRNFKDESYWKISHNIDNRNRLFQTVEIGANSVWNKMFNFQKTKKYPVDSWKYLRNFNLNKTHFLIILFNLSRSATVPRVYITTISKSITTESNLGNSITATTTIHSWAAGIKRYTA